jgi:D-sedoheptulose 7-phosphate isomerase
MWKNKDNVALFSKTYFAELVEAFAKIPEKDIEKATQLLLCCYHGGKQMFLIGNGGSAATASHFANDLSKGTRCEGRKRFKAFSLTDNIPLVTAWANDHSFEEIFVEQLTNLLHPGDLLVAISGSGNSRNILKAVEYVNAHQGHTFGLIGFQGGKLKDLVHESIIVPSHRQEIIEDIHLILEHIICKYISFEIAEKK